MLQNQDKICNSPISIVFLHETLIHREQQMIINSNIMQLNSIHLQIVTDLMQKEVNNQQIRCTKNQCKKGKIAKNHYFENNHTKHII